MKIKEGQWLYYNSGVTTTYVKYNGVDKFGNIKTREHYQFRNSDMSLIWWGECDNVLNIDTPMIRLATTDDISGLIKRVRIF